MATELDEFLNQQLGGKQQAGGSSPAQPRFNLLDVLNQADIVQQAKGTGIGLSRFVKNLPFVGSRLAKAVPGLQALSEMEPETDLASVSRFIAQEAPTFSIAGRVPGLLTRLIPALRSSAEAAPVIRTGIKNLPEGIEQAQSALAATLKSPQSLRRVLLNAAGSGAAIGATSGVLQGGDLDEVLGQSLSQAAAGALLGPLAKYVGGGISKARAALQKQPYDILDATKALRDTGNLESGRLYQQALGPSLKKTSPLAKLPVKIPSLSPELSTLLDKKSQLKFVYNKIKPVAPNEVQPVLQVPEELKPLQQQLLQLPEKPTTFKNLHDVLVGANRELGSVHRALAKGGSSRLQEFEFKRDALKNYITQLKNARANAITSLEDEQLAKLGQTYQQATRLNEAYVQNIPEALTEKITPEAYSRVLAGESRLEDAPPLLRALRQGLAKANVKARGFLPGKLSPDEARVLKGSISK